MPNIAPPGAPAPERNMGDPRVGYPDAAATPEVQLDEAQKPESNPLVGALETVTQFVLLQEQRGSPKAAEMKQHLQALVQTMVGEGQGAPAPQGPPPLDNKPAFDPFSAPPDEAGPPRREREMNKSIQPFS